MSPTMPVRRFWNWTNPTPEEAGGVRVLHLNGAIAEESWFDDEVTPALFKNELNAGSGDVEVWVNSPGGDCIAAAQICNVLTECPGKVTVIIDGLAASAASVIAMAADTVVMSPVSMMMIHNPATLAIGDSGELTRAIEMLDAVKESIINAYQLKTGLQRAKISRLMDAETWMDATAAVKMGFADEIRAPTHHPLRKTPSKLVARPVVWCLTAMLLSAPWSTNSPPTTARCRPALGYRLTRRQACLFRFHVKSSLRTCPSQKHRLSLWVFGW